MSKAIKIFGDYRSSPCRASIAFCQILGFDWELVAIDLAKFENRTEEFYKINPMGQVPAMDDNGLTAFESGAIL